MEEKKMASTPRWLENAHIVLWLIKDTCWAMFWKPGGIFMIFPTISVAIYILWRSRHSKADFFHNLAVCMWICANSVWMLTEFLGVDKQYKICAVYLFLAGILSLVVYYLFFFRKEREEEQRGALAPVLSAADREVE